MLVQVIAKWNCREMRAINEKVLRKAGRAKSEKHRRRVENKFVPVMRKRQRAELVAPPCML
jgi:hypothetical protein